MAVLIPSKSVGWSIGWAVSFLRFTFFWVFVVIGLFAPTQIMKWPQIRPCLPVQLMVLAVYTALLSFNTDFAQLCLRIYATGRFYAIRTFFFYKNIICNISKAL